MDVERLKKINQLAKELLDHGIVSTMDEAYKHAEQMIEKQGVFEEQKEEPKIEINHLNSAPLPPQNIGSAMNPLEIRKLNERIDGIESQISQLYLKVNEIVTEINKVLERMEKKRDVFEVKEEKKSQQATLKQEPEKKNSHPKVGDYKPSDVAIEKMFYFGGGGRQ